MATEATGRESDKFMLRLPDGMRDRLKAEAEANKRSMNAEIVARLEASLNTPTLNPVSEAEWERMQMFSRYQKDIHDRDLIAERLKRLSADIQKMEEALRANGITFTGKGEAKAS